MEDISLKYERDGNAEEYIEAHIQTAPELAQADPNGDTVFSHARRGLREGLLRLHHLPRSHPFWHRTNNRATLVKLGVYNHLRLQEDPHDALAQCSDLGLAILYCDYRLIRPALLLLCENGNIRGDHLVQLFWWVETTIPAATGWKNAPKQETKIVLPRFLKEWSLCEEAQPELDKLCMIGSKSAEWARAVLRGCG